MNDKQHMSALEMSERDIENFEYDYKPECELKESDEVVWNNGDKAYVENSTHDEIIFIGLASNKAIAVCECITSERIVILDKFWVFDLLKERPETTEEKAGRELWGIKSDCSNFKHYSWSELSKESKDEWIEFAKRLGFTTGI